MFVSQTLRIILTNVQIHHRFSLARWWMRTLIMNWVRIKRIRAFCGCLGTERRWRTWHAAIRSGEARAPFDPDISEWGNPPVRSANVNFSPTFFGRWLEFWFVGRSKVQWPEYIGFIEQTRGTETSKYPEERTSNETPLVVASERGLGQWLCVKN